MLKRRVRCDCPELFCNNNSNVQVPIATATASALWRRTMLHSILLETMRNVLIFSLAKIKSASLGKVFAMAR